MATSFGQLVVARAGHASRLLDELRLIVHSCVHAVSQQVVSRADKLLLFQQMSGDLTSHPGPEANLGYLFRLAHQRFRAALEAALQDLGLSAQEYVILSVFETRPELSTSELARITEVTRQTMHTAVLGLETAGLIERRSRNQRVVLVRTTKRGRTTLKAATDRVRAVEQTAFASLNRADERAVRTWLASVAAITTGTRPTGVQRRRSA
jgi:DNA-binding MarR family transcriptional regulator